MNKVIKVFSFLIFNFIVLFIWKTDVYAIPPDGGFSCTYELKYQNVVFQEEYNDLVISYGEYEGSNPQQKYNFSKTITNSSKTVIPNSSLSANFELAMQSQNYVFNMNVEKFYDSVNNKWVCPKISYIVRTTGDVIPYRLVVYAGNGDSVSNDYLIDSASVEESNKGVIIAKEQIINDPGKLEETIDENELSCPPVSGQAGVPIIMSINSKDKKASFFINNQEVKHNLDEFTDSCPPADTINTYIKYCHYNYTSADDYSQDIIVYNENPAQYFLRAGLDMSNYSCYGTSQGSTTTTDANGNTIDVTGGNGGAQIKLEEISWGNLGNDIITLDCGDKDISALMEDISRYYKIIEVIVPILIILFGSLDLSKAVLNQDRDAMQKSIQSFIKRCIAGISIYFLPIILEALFSLPGLPDSETILCGIAMIFR